MSNLKRLLAVLTVWLIILGLNIPVTLASSNNFLQCDNQTGSPGNEVVITISLPDPSGLAGVQYSVTYDKRYFFVDNGDVDDDGLPDGVAVGSDFDINSVAVFNDQGKVNFAQVRSSATPLTSTSELQLARITFTIKENAVNGTHAVSIVKCYGDGGGVEEPMGSAFPGSITVIGGADSDDGDDTQFPSVVIELDEEEEKQKENKNQTTVPVPKQLPSVQQPTPILATGIQLQDIIGHWGQANIEALVNKEVISGYPDGTFRPDATISRAEFTTILVKAFNYQLQNGKVFYDIQHHWARDYIATAQSFGLVTGLTENTFCPDTPITREQMAAMVVKAAALGKLSGSVRAFADTASISGWAVDAVDTATGQFIISGYPDNTFRPQENATRAEAVTVIIKALVVSAKADNIPIE